LCILSEMKDGKGGTSPESEPRIRLHLDNRDHNAAKVETKGYARAYRRAADSQPRGRSGSAVWCPAPRKCALATRFRQSSARRPFRPNIRQERGNRQTESHLDA
jgi:hypothetical protein